MRKVVHNRKFKESVYSLVFSIPIIGSGKQDLDISYHPDNEKAVANLAKKLFKVGDFKVKRDGKTIMAGEGGEITQPHKVDPTKKPETKAPKNKYGVKVDMPFPIGDISAGGGFRLEPADEKNLAGVFGKMSKKFGRPITVKKDGKTIIASDGSEITTPYSYVPPKGDKVVAVKGEEPAEPAPEEPEPEEPVDIELPKPKKSKGEEGDRVSFKHDKLGTIHGLVVGEEDEKGRVKVLTDEGDTTLAMAGKINKSKKPLSTKGQAVQKKAKGGFLKKFVKPITKGAKKYVRKYQKGGQWRYEYECLKRPGIRDVRYVRGTPASRVENYKFRAEMIKEER